MTWFQFFSPEDRDNGTMKEWIQLNDIPGQHWTRTDFADGVCFAYFGEHCSLDKTAMSHIIFKRKMVESVHAQMNSKQDDHTNDLQQVVNIHADAIRSISGVIAGGTTCDTTPEASGMKEETFTVSATTKQNTKAVVYREFGGHCFMHVQDSLKNSRAATVSPSNASFVPPVKSIRGTVVQELEYHDSYKPTLLKKTILKKTKLENHGYDKSNLQKKKKANHDSFSKTLQESGKEGMVGKELGLNSVKVASFKVDTDWLFSDEEMNKAAEWRDEKWFGKSLSFHQDMTKLHVKGMIIDNRHPRELKVLKGRAAMISSGLADGGFKYFFGTITKASRKGEGGVSVEVKYDDYVEPYSLELEYNLWTGGDFWHEANKDNQWRVLVCKGN